MSTTPERPFPGSERQGEDTRYVAVVLRACGALLVGGSAFAQSLVSGGVVRGTISAPGEQDTYTFEARRRERFEMRLVDVHGTDFHPQIELYNPNGALISTSASPDVAVIDTREVVVLTDTGPGTYTVVVSHASGARGHTGDYALHFVLAPGANAGAELLDGVTVFGEIGLGELDSFTFVTEAGRTVTGTVTPLHGGTLRLRVERFSASGYSVGTGGTFQFTTTSSPGGLETLVVSDGSSTATGTGRYSILLHGLPAAPPYPPSVFLPSQSPSDPSLLDNAGNSGLGPRIGDPGEPFNVAIDCTAADTSSVYALLLSTDVRSAASSPWGWVYLDGTVLVRTHGMHLQSVESWFPAPGVSLPDDLALVGRTYTVQGLCGGFGGSVRLSSAITQTIGD